MKRNYFLCALSILICITLIFPFAADARKKKKKKIPKSPSYVGAAKCDSSCHDPWYQAWQKTGHGKTYNLLKPGERKEAKIKAKLDPEKDYTSDPHCLRCHTTGYAQKGGFVPGETKIDPDEPNLEQVGCEMCHSARGGAQFRVLMKNSEGKFKRPETEKYGMRYDFENVCKRCHEHKNSPFQPSLDKKYKFNFAERKKKVHDYKKEYNSDNKDQTYEIEHGHGETEKKPLVIEDWAIVKGKLKFKALPYYKGKFIYKK